VVMRLRVLAAEDEALGELHLFEAVAPAVDL
jgi:hypothetical protein